LQGGAGSGVDVACSVSGGLIEYRVEGCSVRRLDWPAALFYGLVWTGTVASTRDKLAKLDAGLSRPSRVRLASASEAMAEAWVGGDATDVLMEYHDYCECLFRFSVDHDLGIFDAGHDELWRAAAAANLVYKPCGAGGGDIGIVLSTSEAALAAFLGRLPTNFRVMDCKLDTVGVRIDKPTAERP
jgi:phosphomevalonate kinase